jgi:hypothetical protein
MHLSFSAIASKIMMRNPCKMRFKSIKSAQPIVPFTISLPWKFKSQLRRTKKSTLTSLIDFKRHINRTLFLSTFKSVVEAIAENNESLLATYFEPSLYAELQKSLLKCSKHDLQINALNLRKDQTRVFVFNINNIFTVGVSQNRLNNDAKLYYNVKNEEIHIGKENLQNPEQQVVLRRSRGSGGIVDDSSIPKQPQKILKFGSAFQIPDKVPCLSIVTGNMKDSDRILVILQYDVEFEGLVGLNVVDKNGVIIQGKEEIRFRKVKNRKEKSKKNDKINEEEASVTKKETEKKVNKEEVRGDTHIVRFEVVIAESTVSEIKAMSSRFDKNNTEECFQYIRSIPKDSMHYYIVDIDNYMKGNEFVK